MKIIKEGLRVTWKTSWAHTRYSEEIHSDVEFDLSGRVAGREVAEAGGGQGWSRSGSESSSGSLKVAWGYSAETPRSLHADSCNPALGLRRESRRLTQGLAGAVLGVRNLSEKAGHSVSGGSEFICRIFPCKDIIFWRINKTLICCTSFPTLGFSGDICPKITVYMWLILVLMFSTVYFYAYIIVNVAVVFISIFVGRFMNNNLLK